MPSNGWKLPFNLAVGIHVLVLLASLYLPGIFKSKPKFADIYTVSLVNIAEPVAPAPPTKAQEPSPPKAVTKPPPVAAAPPKIKKAEPVEEAPKVVEQAETVEPAPPKAISLKPLKQKKGNHY